MLAILTSSLTLVRINRLSSVEMHWIVLCAIICWTRKRASYSLFFFSHLGFISAIHVCLRLRESKRCSSLLSFSLLLSLPIYSFILISLTLSHSFSNVNL